MYNIAEDHYKKTLSPNCMPTNNNNDYGYQLCHLFPFICMVSAKIGL